MSPNTNEKRIGLTVFGIDNLVSNILAGILKRFTGASFMKLEEPIYA